MTKKSKKSNYKVKKNPWKRFELQIDPELAAAWADDQELPEGQFKQCWPHGKYPHPLMLDQMVDTMWAQHPDGSWPAGKDTMASSWCDPDVEILPLRIVVCKPKKRVIVDILTPELMEIIAQAQRLAPQKATSNKRLPNTGLPPSNIERKEMA